MGVQTHYLTASSEIKNKNKEAVGVRTHNLPMPWEKLKSKTKEVVGVRTHKPSANIRGNQVEDLRYNVNVGVQSRVPMLWRLKIKSMKNVNAAQVIRIWVSLPKVLY